MKHLNCGSKFYGSLSIRYGNDIIDMTCALRADDNFFFNFRCMIIGLYEKVTMCNYPQHEK